MLKNCELLKVFKRGQLRRGKRKAGELKIEPELNLERGPLGSNIIFQEVVVAGVPVKALVDSGATASCCGRRWYQKYHVEIGPLMNNKTQVIGVGNTPIFMDGRIARLLLEWKEATSAVSLLVVPSLIEPDMILNMDLLQRLGIKIDTEAGVAEPTVLVSCIQLLETGRILARK